MDWSDPAAILMQAAGLIAAWVGERPFEEFGQDELVLSAVCFQLILAGEAAKLLPSSKRPDRLGHLLRLLIGVRNTLAHDPFDLSTAEIWQAAKLRLPRIVTGLGEQIGSEEN